MGPSSGAFQSSAAGVLLEVEVQVLGVHAIVVDWKGEVEEEEEEEINAAFLTLLLVVVRFFDTSTGAVLALGNGPSHV